MVRVICVIVGVCVLLLLASSCVVPWLITRSNAPYFSMATLSREVAVALTNSGLDLQTATDADFVALLNNAPSPALSAGFVDFYGRAPSLSTVRKTDQEIVLHLVSTGKDNRAGTSDDITFDVTLVKGGGEWFYAKTEQIPIGTR